MIPNPEYTPMVYVSRPDQLLDLMHEIRDENELALDLEVSFFLKNIINNYDNDGMIVVIINYFYFNNYYCSNIRKDRFRGSPA